MVKPCLEHQGFAVDLNLCTTCLQAEIARLKAREVEEALSHNKTAECLKTMNAEVVLIAEARAHLRFDFERLRLAIETHSKARMPDGTGWPDHDVELWAALKPREIEIIGEMRPEDRDTIDGLEAEAADWMRKYHDSNRAWEADGLKHGDEVRALEDEVQLLTRKLDGPRVFVRKICELEANVQRLKDALGDIQDYAEKLTKDNDNEIVIANIAKDALEDRA